jgi:hypothetical protein
MFPTATFRATISRVKSSAIFGATESARLVKKRRIVVRATSAAFISVNQKIKFNLLMIIF